MPETQAPLTLYSFSVSHFSEKIRWALDAAGLPYRETRLTPFLHMPRTLALTRKATSVPILQAGDQVIQDSTRILEWLEREQAPFPLIPADPALRKEVLEIESRFDRVGFHVVRVAYGNTLDHRAEALHLWTLDATPLQKALLHAAFPLVRRGFRRLLRMSPAALAKSSAAIDEAADWIAARVRAGRPYLAGDRLSVADIAACALMAPVVCPETHPVFGSARYRRLQRMNVVRWDDHPGFEWVREVYRRDRGAAAG